MSTAVTVNPDLHMQQLFVRERLERELSPHTLRAKLKSAGLDPNQARAPRPIFPAVAPDFAWFERFLVYRDLFEDLFIIATTPARSRTSQGRLALFASPSFP